GTLSKTDERLVTALKDLLGTSALIHTQLRIDSGVNRLEDSSDASEQVKIDAHNRAAIDDKHDMDDKLSPVTFATQMLAIQVPWYDVVRTSSEASTCQTM